MNTVSKATKEMIKGLEVEYNDVQELIKNFSSKELYKILNNTIETFSLDSSAPSPAPSPASINYKLLIIEDEFDFSNDDDVELFLEMEEYFYDNIFSKLSNDKLININNIIEYN